MRAKSSAIAKIVPSNTVVYMRFDIASPLTVVNYLLNLQAAVMTVSGTIVPRSTECTSFEIDTRSEQTCNPTAKSPELR